MSQGLVPRMHVLKGFLRCCSCHCTHGTPAAGHDRQGIYSQFVQLILAVNRCTRFHEEMELGGFGSGTLQAWGPSRVVLSMHSASVLAARQLCEAGVVNMQHLDCGPC